MGGFFAIRLWAYMLVYSKRNFIEVSGYIYIHAQRLFDDVISTEHQVPEVGGNEDDGGLY